MQQLFFEPVLYLRLFHFNQIVQLMRMISAWSRFQERYPATSLYPIRDFSEMFPTSVVRVGYTEMAIEALIGVFESEHDFITVFGDS